MILLSNLKWIDFSLMSIYRIHLNRQIQFIVKIIYYLKRIDFLPFLFFFFK